MRDLQPVLTHVALSKATFSSSMAAQSPGHPRDNHSSVFQLVKPNLLHLSTQRKLPSSSTSSSLLLVLGNLGLLSTKTTALQSPSASVKNPSTPVAPSTWISASSGSWSKSTLDLLPPFMSLQQSMLPTSSLRLYLRTSLTDSSS